VLCFCQIRKFPGFRQLLLVNSLNLTAKRFCIRRTYRCQSVYNLIDDVAAATQANVVVNYPECRVLNPLMPLTRAEAAAHLISSLGAAGTGTAIANNVVAHNMCGRSTGGNQNTQSVQPLLHRHDSLAIMTVDLASSSFNIDFCIEEATGP